MCSPSVETVSNGNAVQCPDIVASEEVAERLQKLPGGSTAPLNVHLRQEVDRLNIVLRIARQTLESLRLAIAGARLA